MPLVSVIIPFYRMERFLPEALASVAAQTWQEWEIIVADDASPTPAAPILDAFSATHGTTRLRLIRHPSNRGVGAARNSALAAARGDWFALLDPDDAWHPGFLSRTLGASAGPGPDLVAAVAECLDDRTRAVTGLIGPDQARIDRFPTSLFQANFLQPCATLVSRPAWERIGPFTEEPELQHHEDWDYWLRAVTAGCRFHFITEPLAIYRRHAAAASHDTLRMHRLAVRCLRRHRHLRPVPASKRRDIRIDYAREAFRIALEAGQWPAASDACSLLEIAPWRPRLWLRVIRLLTIYATRRRR